MEDYIESVCELLNFEDEVLIRQRVKRSQLSTQSRDTSEQFFYFAMLSIFLLRELLRKSGKDVSKELNIQRTDDTSLILEKIRQLVAQCGIEELTQSFNTSTFRQPYGSHVISFLHKISQLIMQLHGPIRTKLNQLSGTSKQDNLERVVDIVDDTDTDSDGSPNDRDPVDMKQSKKHYVPLMRRNYQNHLAETERNASLLLQNHSNQRNETLNWRHTLKQLEAFTNDLEQISIESKVLGKFVSSLDESIDKIESREKFINENISSLNLKTVSSDINLMKKSIDTVNSSISKLSASLSDTDISLANTEAQLEMIGSGMSDPKPLVEAREAKQNLTKDRKDIRAKTRKNDGDEVPREVKKEKIDNLSARGNLADAFKGFKKFQRYPSANKKSEPAAEVIEIKDDAPAQKTESPEVTSSTAPVSECVHFLDPDAVVAHKYTREDFFRKTASPPKEIPKAVDFDYDASEYEKECLVNLTFVITGDLSVDRDSVTNFIKRLGGRVTGAVSGKTSFLVVGSEPGATKVDKAKKLNVKMVDEKGLSELVKLKSKEVELGVSSTATQSPPKKTASPAAGKKKAATLKAAASTPAVVSASGPIRVASHAKMPSTAPSTVPASSEATSSLDSLWTEKYKPRSLHEIIGQKSIVENLRKFILDYNSGNSKFKAALLSGPPGIGKTTMSHLVAKECGYDVIEMNASEVRNKNAMNGIVREILGSRSISEYFVSSKNNNQKSKKHLLIMDEVDGMSAGDRGGMQALIQLIKKSHVPIVCICNDRQSQKVRSLANYCLDLRCSRPSAAMARSRIQDIARREGLTFDVNALEELIAITQGDIRQILNIMQSTSLSNKTRLSFDDAHEMTKKNVELNPFDVASRLLSPYGKPLDERFDLYFNDYQLIPLFVQENYVKMGPRSGQFDLNHLKKLADASECLAEGEVIERFVFSRQDYSLLPTHAAYSSIIPVTLVSGVIKERLGFPAVLGQMSKTNKVWRVLKEITNHLSLTTSGCKNDIRLNYLPLMFDRISSCLKKGTPDDIQEAVKWLTEYDLTKEDWDALVELILKSEEQLKQIPSAAKSAFTRTYNKSSHTVPFAIQDLKKLKATSTAEQNVALDGEEIVGKESAIDDNEEEEQNDDGADRMVVTKNTKAKGKGKAAASGSKSGRGRGGSSKASTSRAGSSRGRGKSKK